MMDSGYKGRPTAAAFEPSSFSPHQNSQKRNTTSTTKHPYDKNTSLSSNRTLQISQYPPPTTTSRRKMGKCAYCGNDSSTYSCNCGSEYASTSSFDKTPTSLNDPKPELGSGSSRYTGVGGSSYTSTQSTDYVGKPSNSSSQGSRR
ncbi:hypothetical protein PV04_01375 [Phialophora macrospora]|uniref:Uncharacterized protein n=1 Tax=Phialophora macrospora TaxID=1851006 RepID=A0A0D2D6P5_9EURO|nr:hypothetical protein PV04_01375 [Phialophora macrospora]